MSIGLTGGPCAMLQCLYSAVAPGSRVRYLTYADSHVWIVREVNTGRRMQLNGAQAVVASADESLTVEIRDPPSLPFQESTCAAFPAEFQQLVRTVLLCHNRCSGERGSSADSSNSYCSAASTTTEAAVMATHGCGSLWQSAPAAALSSLPKDLLLAILTKAAPYTPQDAAVPLGHPDVLSCQWHDAATFAQLVEGTKLPWNASINVDMSQQLPMSQILHGIFFEEIGHAGEGGLYAEMVQDRSFDALAAATGFHASEATRLPLDLARLASSHRHAMDPIHAAWEPSQATYSSKKDYLSERASRRNYNPSNDIIIAWQALPGTTAALTKDRPLNNANPVAMELTTGDTTGGIVNLGYWGVSVVADKSYTLSLYARTTQASGGLAVGTSPNVTVALTNAQGSQYASARLEGLTPEWRKFTAELTSSTTDHESRVQILFDGPGSLVIDMVSLFPTENVKRGRGFMNPWPFREDLLGALKALKPGFLRFPGGCYIEGDWMRNAFYWKQSIGAMEARTGHLNGVWGYWSTDGLGLFEYMQLAEELKTEPVWVISNGVAHADSVPGSAIMPMVQDALDSLEFIMGPPDSTWGSIRASMGRPEPWTVNYMAIGNEDCGKPYYVNNYLAFFGAISAKYPHMRLIANCDMGQDAPTDLWDWHIYTHPNDMFEKRNEFNGRTPANSHYIFASEYAVTQGGGWGNLIGAVSEAAFMTGLERNGDIVHMAAYAPLFVHTNNRPWPTNMIVIDNHQWYGIPSYYVQQLFREVQGTHYLATSVATNPSTEVHEEKIAASATCQNPACDRVALKIINFSSYNQLIAVTLGGRAGVSGSGALTYITGAHPEDENTFDNPTKVFPGNTTVDGLSNEFVIPVQPWSVNALMVTLSTSPSAEASVAEA
ncbi:hypothetical protein N2152v2_005011 [Parachlorella kessleri]